jgi:hypothetical protein
MSERHTLETIAATSPNRHPQKPHRGGKKMGGQPCYTNQGNAVGYGHRQRGWRTVRQCSALGNPVLRTWVGTWTSARHLHSHCLSLAHPTRVVLWLHQGVLFFLSRCLTLTWSRRIMSPARSFHAIEYKQPNERAGGMCSVQDIS